MFINFYMPIDKKFQTQYKHYLLQSSYAALTVFFLTMILNWHHAVSISSIGAMAFIVFSMPKSYSSKSGRIIGGHIIGFIVGCIFSIFPYIDLLFFAALWYGLAVGVSFILMSITDTEHPPAIGTAVGMTIVGYSHTVAIGISLSILILVLIHKQLKPYIQDLV